MGLSLNYTKKTFDLFLLINFLIFFILTPYSIKYYSKYSFLLSFLVYLIILIIEFKSRFYRYIIPDSALNRYFSFFGIACILSIIFSINPYHSQAVFFERYLIFTGFFWLGVYLHKKSPKNIYLLALGFMLSSFIFAIGAIRDYIVFGKLNPILVERLFSVFGKTIEYYAFPVYLAFFIPFNFSMFVIARQKFLKSFAVINFFLLSLCLFWNGSRIAMFSIAFTVLLIAALNLRKSYKRISLLAVIGLLSLCLSITFSYQLNVSNLKWRVKTLFQPSEWSNRMPLYHAAASIFLDYKLLGSGIGTFEKLLHTPQYKLPDSYPVDDKWNLHAHNTYLEILSEMGIFGLTAFILLLFMGIIKTIRYLTRATTLPADSCAIGMGLIMAVIAVIIFAFGTSIITVGITVSSYFWFIFGLATGFLKNKELTP